MLACAMHCAWNWEYTEKVIPFSMDWMFVSSPNSYVEALIPNVMVFGGAAFGR